MARSISSGITTALKNYRHGAPEAIDRLLPLVYGELRRRAVLVMRSERHWHTLQPTAVVHEAFIRLFYDQEIDWQNSNQFFFVASREMRHVLTGYARARIAEKRGGNLSRIPLEDIEAAGPEESSLIELAALGKALSQLEHTDDQLARLVELRYFAGMSVEEVAKLLGVSVSETGRLWRLAKSLLRSRLGG